MSVLRKIPLRLDGVLDTLGLLLIVAGVLALLGLGAALIAAGLASLVLAWMYGR